MSSPLVETCPNLDIPLDFTGEIDDSGFPFDNSDRDDRFQSKLDDIAKRHPEFADQLNPLQGWSRPRGPSTSHFREAPRQQNYNDNIFDRPFSRIDFSNFGFDDTDSFFDRAPRREEPVFTQQPQQQQQSQPPTQEPSHKPPSNSSEPAEAAKAPEVKPKQNPTLHQSNTVDLGQQQEPVDDCRNQRSMSAPPENRTGRRFVSSINIPNLNTGAADMGARQSQEPNPQPSNQQQNKPNERIIPIHIEGRDEPVMPKNVNTTFTSANAAPQPEKLFGQRPSNFTQFLNRNEQAEQNEQEEMLRQQHMKQQQQEYQRQQQENYQRQQQENFQRQQQEQQQQQQQQQNQQQQPPPPAPKKPTPLEIIQSIQVNVSDLMTKVEKFNGKPKDKEYLYLDEMLTRNLLKLDNIETEGKDTIRQARREAIKCIEGYINILEKKAAANEKAMEEKMEIEKEPTPEADSDKKDAMEIEGEIKPSETEAPKLEEVKKEGSPEKKDDIKEEKKEENAETKPDEIQMEQDANKEEATQKPEEPASESSETKKEKAKTKKKK